MFIYFNPFTPIKVLNTNQNIQPHSVADADTDSLIGPAIKLRAGSENSDSFSSSSAIPQPIMVTLKKHIQPWQVPTETNALLPDLKKLQTQLRLSASPEMRIKNPILERDILGLHPFSLPEDQLKALATPTIENNGTLRFLTQAIEQEQQQLQKANAYVASHPISSTGIEQGRHFLLAQKNALITESTSQLQDLLQPIDGVVPDDNLVQNLLERQFSQRFTINQFFPNKLDEQQIIVDLLDASHFNELIQQGLITQSTYQETIASNGLTPYTELNSVNLSSSIAELSTLPTPQTQERYLNLLTLLQENLKTPTPMATVENLYAQYDKSGGLYRAVHAQRTLPSSIALKEQQLRLEVPIQAYMQDLALVRPIAENLGVLPAFEKANANWFQHLIEASANYYFSLPLLAPLRDKITAVASNKQSSVIPPDLQEALLRAMQSDKRPQPITTHGKQAKVLDFLRCALADKAYNEVSQAIDYLTENINTIDLNALLETLRQSS